MTSTFARQTHRHVTFVGQRGKVETKSAQAAKAQQQEAPRSFLKVLFKALSALAA